MGSVIMRRVLIKIEKKKVSQAYVLKNSYYEQYEKRTSHKKKKKKKNYQV